MSIKGFANNSVYSATKAAVRSFARTWTAEIPVDQVRFNVLSPGPVETPIQDKMGMTEEIKQGLAAMMPIKRQGTAEEMAKAALFLASSDSSYVVEQICLRIEDLGKSNKKSGTIKSPKGTAYLLD